MDILKLIKNRCTVRKYKDKLIPQKVLAKIIEAGRWGPSVPSFLQIQPWQFVVVLNKNSINDISEIILKKAKKANTGVNLLLSSAARIIKGSSVVVVIYNSKELEKIKNKYKLIFLRFSKIIRLAQFSAIAAAIQNMILMAESLGVGSCWLDTPLFCKKEINRHLHINEEMVAVLTFGYPAEKGKRSQRKTLEEMVYLIK